MSFAVFINAVHIVYASIYIVARLQVFIPTSWTNP